MQTREQAEPRVHRQSHPTTPRKSISVDGQSPSPYGMHLQIPDLSIEPSFHIQDLSIKNCPSTRPLLPMSVTRPPHVSGSMLLSRSDLGPLFDEMPAGQLSRQENAGTVQSRQPFGNDINDQIVHRSTTYLVLTTTPSKTKR